MPRGVWSYARSELPEKVAAFHALFEELGMALPIIQCDARVERLARA